MCQYLIRKNSLRFLIDTFISAKCFEWVFLLGLVLKRFTIINELFRQVNAGEVSSHVAISLKNGIKELDLWSQNEW